MESQSPKNKTQINSGKCNCIFLAKRLDGWFEL
jgi:hypothetical protein